MVGAYSDVTHSLADVDKTKFLWEMTLRSDGHSLSGRKLGLPGHADHGPTPWTNVHGLLMWLSWTVLALVQVVTNRYMVDKYRWRQTVHTVSGIAIIVLTIFSFVVAFGQNTWKVVFNYPHAIVANPTVWIGVLVAFGGIFAKFSRDKSGNGTYDWRSDDWMSFVRVHRLMGYFMIFLAQFAMALGINCKWYDKQMVGMVWGVVILNLAFFFTVLFVFEMNRWSTLDKCDLFKPQ